MSKQGYEMGAEMIAEAVKRRLVVCVEYFGKCPSRALSRLVGFRPLEGKAVLMKTRCERFEFHGVVSWVARLCFVKPMQCREVDGVLKIEDDISFVPPRVDMMKGIGNCWRMWMEKPL